MRTFLLGLRHVVHSLYILYTDENRSSLCLRLDLRSRHVRRGISDLKR